jgi:hypothetical protein
MASATAKGTEKYLEKIDRANDRHLDALREIRADALEDLDLPDLDRAVLGLTGSPERLEQFRTLSERVVRNIGRPLIIIEATRRPNRDNSSEIVSQAYGGVVAGEMKIRFGTPLSHSDDEEEPKIDSAHMYVPVLPVFAYQHFEGSGFARQPEINIWVNSDTGKYDKKEKKGKLEVAHIRPNYDRRPNEAEEAEQT